MFKFVFIIISIILIHLTFVFGYLMPTFFQSFSNRINYQYSNLLTAILIIFSLHSFLFLIIISLLKTIYTDPGRLPVSISNEIETNMQLEMEKEGIYLRKIKREDFELLVRSHFNKNLVLEDFDEQVSQIAFNSVLENKKIRFCNHCNDYKPNRTYHCKLCGRCVIKKDHHNAILGKCIGIGNYKYFILLLFYLNCYFANIFLFSLEPINHIFTKSQINEYLASFFLFLFVYSGILFIIYFCLLIFHLVLIFKGISTVEFLEEKKYRINKETYYKRFTNVFNSNVFYWCLPFKFANQINLKNFGAANNEEDIIFNEKKLN